MSTDSTVVRVATYRRASTGEENQPYSLDAQLASLQRFIESQPGMVAAADYVERVSGKNTNRAQFQRLMKHAEAGRFDLVLVYRLDRWSRSLSDVMDTVRRLQAVGVQFRSATESFDTTGASGMMLMQMLSIFAEFERRSILERINRGNATKASRGLQVGGVPCYGLRRNQVTGILETDADTFPIVERIFTRYTTGEVGLVALANELNADGLRTSRGGLWASTRLADILGNRTYIGEIRYKGAWLPGAHSAFIDEAMFATAAALRAKRTRSDAARRASSDYLLSGVLYCSCGGAIAGTSSHSKAGRYRYYSCVSSLKTRKRSCPGTRVRADALETQIIDIILNTLADTNLLAEAFATQHDHGAAERAQHASELKAARHRAASLSAKMARYITDYESGDLPARLFTARHDELLAQEAAVKLRITELEYELQEEPACPRATDFEGLAAKFADALRNGNTRLRSQLLELLIERIDIDGHDATPILRIPTPEVAVTLLVTRPTPDTTKEPAPAGAGSSNGPVCVYRPVGWRQVPSSGCLPLGSIT